MKTQPTWIRLALFLALLAAAAQGADDYVKMWDGKAVQALAAVNHGWGPYAGQPNDGWKSSPGVSSTLSYSGKGALPEPLQFRVTFEKPLPVGNYRVHVRNFYRGKMEVTLGHESKYVQIVRQDWSTGAPFEVDPAQKAADCVLIKLYPTMVQDSGAAQTQNYLLQGVFITTDFKKIPKEDGRILELTPPEAPPSRTGNYLEGGSFESGLGHGWGKPSGATYIIDAGNLDEASNAPDGQCALRLPIATTALVNAKPRLPFLESKMYMLPPGKEFVLSFYAKSDVPLKIGAGLCCMNGDLKNYAGGGISGTAELTTEWKRFEITGKSTEAPAALNCVQFSQPDIAGAATVWLDGIQLEEGTKASAFQTAAPVEVGHACALAGNIYFDSEPGALELRFSNTGLAKSTTLSHRIEDYWGKVVAEGTREVLLPGKTHRENFVLPTGSRGIFRATFRAGGGAGKGAASEIVYSVLPPSASLTKKVPNGSVGMDCAFGNVKALKIFKRANFHWLHAKHAARWAGVEPQKGQFIFQDATMKAAHDAGFTLILQIFNEHPDPQPFLTACLPGEGVDAAKWFKENPEKKQAYLKHFSEYVTALAERYKPWVSHYEIDNEPNANTVHAAMYPEMLKTAYEALKKVNPENTVIGFSMGGYGQAYETWTAAGAMKHCDAASIHVYGGSSEARFLKQFGDLIAKHSKPGWNTETGLSCGSFYRLPVYEGVMQKDYWTDVDRDNRFLTNTQTRNYLRSMAVKGMQRYIYYFGRYGNAGPSQPTRWGGSCKEIGEFDGALRSTGVALALASQHLDGAAFSGELNVHELVAGAIFEREGKARGFFFKHDQSDDAGLALEFPADAVKGLRFFDLMGNPVGNGKPPAITATPVYFTADVPVSKVKEWLAAPLRAAGP